ncbi:unnamed protein product [Rhizoctonia solani]|uniref:F-box domain-containing protein n=1 Tax=Rhizoctonia solani TaxID=456999 RepID=A0A8H3HT11_9AGAM|nr:unnamed protein product [Rhizoctonia solani]
MLDFTLLPTESIVRILSLLPPTDIGTCKLVSRYLLSTIQQSLELQYSLELDSHGFVPPLNPLNSLSLSQKVLALQKKFSFTEYPTQQDITLSNRRFILDLPVNPNLRYSRGVLTVISRTLSIKQIEICQLASRNKNTEYSLSVLHNIGIEASDWRFDPDLDLLVLIEEVTPDDPNIYAESRFHLRSLSTGLSHPLASTPIIACPFGPLLYFETNFQIFGRLLAFTCRKRCHQENVFGMYIWDWITGELVSSTAVVGQDFAFVSEDVFIVGATHHNLAQFDIIGSLEVYTIRNILPGSPARHIASLELPLANDVSHSRCRFIITPPPPTPININGHPKVTTPKRIYELESRSRYLCLHITKIYRNYTTMAFSGQFKSLLLIPLSTIHPFSEGNYTSQPAFLRSIPWEDWARGASWISGSLLDQQNYSVFGSRAAFLSPDSKEGLRVLLYDLSATVQGPMVNELGSKYIGKKPDYLPSNALFVTSQTDTRELPMVASFLVPNVSEVIYSRSPNLVIDDEHVVIYERGLSGLMLTDYHI